MSQDCKRFEESLLELAYGELAESETEDLRMHATGCPKCRDALESILLTRKLAAQLPMAEPGDDLDRVILGAAREQADLSATESSDDDKAKVEDIAGARPEIVDTPGPFEWLRTLLLRPAFATAALATLIFAFTFFLTEKGLSPVEREQDSIDTPMPVSTAGEAYREERSAESPKKGAIEKEVTGKDEMDGKLDLDQAPIIQDLLRGEDGFAKASAKKPDTSKRAESKSSRKRSSGKAGFGDITTINEQFDKEASRGVGAGPTDLQDDLDNVLGGSFAKPPPSGSVPASGGGGGRAAATDTRSLDFESPPAAQAALEESEAEAAPSMAQTPAAETGTVSGFAPEPDSEPASDFDLGASAYSRGDCKTAVAHFMKVIEQSSIYASNRAYAMHHVAKCEKRRGKFASAEAWYDKLLILYTGYNRRAEALYESAKCLMRMGQENRARKRLGELADIPTWTDRAKRELERLSE